MLVAIFGFRCKLDVYRIWNCAICSRHAAEVFLLPIFYQILSLNKRKFFIGGFSKQYGFASQEFLVVRGND